MKVTACAFHEILPIWRQELWPGRKSEICPNSAIAPDGSVDQKWLSALCYFYKVETDKKIIGTVSALKLGKNVRSRGLWVHPDLRGKKIASQLLQAVESHAEQSQSTIWTMSRASAFDFYTKMNYTKYAEIEGYEYGPHILCRKELSV